MLVLCALAFALQLGPAFANRFHADEALYATWAMQVASGRDVLLAKSPLDKPPLAFYTMAASLFVFGRVEIAARLPSLIASVVSVALAWRWSRILHPSPFILHPSSFTPHPSSFAALVTALSPFSIAFGGTAFLDPLMVMWGLAACVAAGRGRAGWGGLFLGLAFATKVQGLLFAPLVLFTAGFSPQRREGYPISLESLPRRWRLRGSLAFMLVIIRKCSRPASSRAVRVPADGEHSSPRRLRGSSAFVAGFGSVVAAVALWSLARGGTPFYVQQTINYGGIRLAFTSELGPRLNAWLGLLPYVFGPVLGAGLAIGLPILLLDAFLRRPRTRQAAVDALLCVYALGFLAFHWLLAFPVWDRYLLILVPVLAMLLGRWISWLVSWLVGWPADRVSVRSPANHQTIQRTNHSTTQLSTFILMALLILPFSFQATQNGAPIGGDHGAHDGIDRVEAYLRDLPMGTVVYDHWLGWELDFYLWDAALYRAYFDTPADLARDLRAFGRVTPHYLVVPMGESSSKVERVIAAEGFALKPALTALNRFGQESFVVYQIAAR